MVETPIVIIPPRLNAVLRIKLVFAGRVQIYAQKYMRQFVDVMVGLMKMNVRRTDKASVPSMPEFAVARAGAA